VYLRYIEYRFRSAEFHQVSQFEDRYEDQVRRVFFFFLCYSVHNVVSVCNKSGDVPAHRAQVQQLNDKLIDECVIIACKRSVHRPARRQMKRFIIYSAA